MPIKFRCEHCRQLLGISRSKAGQISDCPTCGRSLRVPELDGRKDPLPPPELDYADSRLAGALNELAQIGVATDEDEAAGDEPDQTPQKAEIITPEPLAEPIVMEAPAVESRGEPQPPPGGTDAAHEHGKSNPAATDDALSELARGQSTPEKPVAVKSRRQPIRWRSLLSAPVIGMLAGALLLGFGLGYLTGGGTSGESAPVSNGNGSETTPTTAAAGDHAEVAVKGRITYKNEDGDSRPDRQARVLVFPAKRVGQRKLDVTGLRASDAPDDFRSAAAAFRALGGDVALVDDKGQFELLLPAAGNYQILVLSNYQPRDTEEAIAAPLMNLLSQYFDRPEQLLGRVAYHFAQIRYQGAEPVPWDHAF